MPANIFFDSSQEAIADLPEQDRAFLHRIYGGDLSRYSIRLDQIGFNSLGNVLDAGAGFGQWSIALAEAENVVYALDANWQRNRVLSWLSKRNESLKIFATTGYLEKLPFSDGFFDGIFSFSSIYFSDYQISLQELSRVLKKDGKLYINTNDIGWFLFLMFSNHNRAKNYNPRLYAIKSMINTVLGRKKGFSEQQGSQFTPVRRITRILERAGLTVIDVQEDGKIYRRQGLKRQLPFLPGKFLGFMATYEILAVKN